MRSQAAHGPFDAAAAALLLVALVDVPVLGQTTSRVSVATGGAQASGDSNLPSISADGRHVAFDCLAGNLVGGDANSAFDAFVRDLAAGTTECVSVGPSGTPGNSHSLHPVLSLDGRYVVFESAASDLVAGDTNGGYDVFLRDRAVGSTERVSVASNGAEAHGWSTNPAVSADGRFVVFRSLASDLVAGDTNGVDDVFVRDRLNGTTERISVDSGGAEANGASTLLGRSISADGRFVAFHSDASNLVGGDTNSAADVFVRDRLTGTTERVSIGPGGVEGDADSRSPALSADGRHVVFHSAASNLVVGDTAGFVDAFLHDRQSGTTLRLSVDAGGTQGNADTWYPTLAPDGGSAVFWSFATNLVAGDTNGRVDTFVRDLQAATIERVSLDSQGVQGNQVSGFGSLSAGGRYVAFWSYASNLVAGDTNARSDIFLRDRRPSFTVFCAGDGLDLAHTTPCPCGNNGAPGHGCANSVEAAGGQLHAVGATHTDDLRLVGSGMPPTSSCIYLQGDALDDATFGDGVRCAGGNLIRLRMTTNVAGASTMPDPSDTFTLSSRGSVMPFSGERRWYQAYYRNSAAAFCTPETFNVTNGVVVDW
jgi:Tol biopolymer transport system component